MIQDPYKVLGVPTTASDEEVKRAYRQLAKKYHPDANPGDKQAEKRMKEINAAYDQIMNKSGAQGGATGQQQQGGYNPFNPFNPFGSYGGGQQATQEEPPKMRAAANYIQYGRYQEALNVLNEIKERTARWYYYSAQANYGVGNRTVALQHAERAASMEPDNFQYRQFLERLKNPGRAYTSYGRGYSMPNFNMSKLCCGVCIANSLCNFFYRYGLFCC